MDQRRDEQMVFSVRASLLELSWPTCQSLILSPSAPCDVTTFSNASHSHFLAAATTNLELLFLNSMTGSVVRQAPTPSVVTQLQFSHSVLLSGSSDGFLRVHDPRTGMGRAGAAESVIKSHMGSIQGLQTVGNFAFTIGMGER